MQTWVFVKDEGGENTDSPPNQGASVYSRSMAGREGGGRTIVSLTIYQGQAGLAQSGNVARPRLSV